MSMDILEVWEREENNVHFLMRRMHICPDYATFHNDMRIKWMQEINLRSFELIPYSFFQHNVFSEIIKGENYIKIDLCKWLATMADISSVFRNNILLRNIVSKSIQNWLDTYEKKLTEYEDFFLKQGYLDSKSISELFELMAVCDSFAIFNMIIPNSWYKKKIEELDIPLGKASLHDFLISFVTPHRNLVRDGKLLLALELLENGYIEENSLSKFIKDTLPYDEFEKWCFDDSKLTDSRIVIREINNIATIYSNEEIINELNESKSRRLAKVNNFYNAMNTVIEYAKDTYSSKETRNLLESLSFLALITTQEEKRHMLEARHCVLIGRIMRKLELDVARTRINDILNTADRLWKGDISYK